MPHGAVASNSDVTVVFSGYLREPSALPEGEAHSVMGRYRAGDWSWLRWAKGVFSFTIVDGRNGRCVLAVDRLGMRPLYFSQDATGIAFGEDLARRDGKLELDYDTLQEIMALGFPLSTPTFVRNVERVGPGIWIEFSAGRRRATRYWSLDPLPPMRNQDPSVFLDESQARVREVLRLARRAVPVELRLRFALPIARGTRRRCAVRRGHCDLAVPGSGSNDHRSRRPPVSCVADLICSPKS